MKRKKMLWLSVIVLLLTSVLGLGSCDLLTFLNFGENGNESVGEKPEEKPDEDGEREESPNPVVRELRYRISADGTYYIVTGMGTCSDSELVIPATYKGLPVTEIGKDAFYKCNN